MDRAPPVLYYMAITLYSDVIMGLDIAHIQRLDKRQEGDDELENLAALSNNEEVGSTNLNLPVPFLHTAYQSSLH